MRDGNLNKVFNLKQALFILNKFNLVAMFATLILTIFS